MPKDEKGPTMKMATLRLRIKQLRDGRFKVQYYWSIWETTNIEYFENKDALISFLTKMVKRTMWV